MPPGGNLKFRADRITFLGLIAAGLAILSACGGTDDGDLGLQLTTYVTSSNVGDLATWSVDGTTVSAVWSVTNPSVGTVKETFVLSGQCGAVDSTFGTKACTLGQSTCLPGTGPCGASDAPPVGSIVQLAEATGLGLMVLTPSPSPQLFVGIAAASCSASSAGDFVFVNTGLGQYSLLGLYRFDQNFKNIENANFRMTGSVSSPLVTYDGLKNWLYQTSGLTCSDGIRSFVWDSVNYSTVLTHGGALLFDKPSGQGGSIGFNLANAAKVSDLSNIKLAGFAFPDSSGPVRMAMSTGSAVGDAVPLTSFAFDVAYPAPAPTKLQTFGSVTHPFNAASSPANLSPPAATYDSNPLQSTYPNLSKVPGLFYIPAANPLVDTGSVVVAATIQNGLVMLVGGIFDDRSSRGVATSQALPNTGNFIAFQWDPTVVSDGRLVHQDVLWSWPSVMNFLPTSFRQWLRKHW